MMYPKIQLACYFKKHNKTQKELNCKKSQIIPPHRLACEDSYQSPKLTSLSLVKHNDLPVKFCKLFPWFYKLFRVLALVSSRKCKFIPRKKKKKIYISISFF